MKDVETEFSWPITAILKDDDPFPFKHVPLKTLLEVPFRDPRDDSYYLGYQVALDLLPDEMWGALYEDLARRFPDVPPKEELRKTLEDQGGMPLRSDRVKIVVVPGAKWVL